MRWVILFVCFVVGYFLVMRLMPSSPRRQNDADPERVTTSNWYRILGVREDASYEEIKAAYKRCIGQYHPDKVAQLGEDIRAVAEAKTKQINAAYEIGSRLFRS